MVEMQPGWRERFAAMQAEARERAKPRPGHRLHSLRDLLKNQDLPDGTQMDETFMDGLICGGMEQTLLEGLNAYIEFPNILRRPSERSGERWYGWSPAEVETIARMMIKHVEEAVAAEDAEDARDVLVPRRQDLPAVGSFHA